MSPDILPPLPSPFHIGEVIYRNALDSLDSMRDFRMEGQVGFDFSHGALRLHHQMAPSMGQKANFLLWCTRRFPADIAVSWEFRPVSEPGLAMLWFCVDGTEGRDLFDGTLAPRDGQYGQYHSGDINGYHASYFRRKNPKGERDFHTCNLRKSKGFHLVCQGADPLPDARDASRRYRIRLVKCADRITFTIDDLLIYDWRDDGVRYGPVLGSGYVGFRQMSPLVAEYADLEVREVQLESAP